MQKKLLLLMIMSCSISMYAEDYTEELIAEYIKALDAGSSIDGVYTTQQTKNDNERATSRSHQCNGRHISQPDENSVAGRAHAEIEEEYKNKTKINIELRDMYKDNCGFDKELTHRAYVMTGIYLDALNRCGRDTPCLKNYDAPAWEEISKAGFIDQRYSMAYESVLYNGKTVLTREQKEKLAENNPAIKELVTKLNEAKQAVQDKIDALKK